MIESENNVTKDQFSSIIIGRSLKKRKHCYSGGRARKKRRLSLLNLIARKNVETLSTPIAMWKQYLMFPLLKLLEKEGENMR